MELTVKYGRTVDNELLGQIYKLDTIVYPDSLQGVLENLCTRHEFLPDSFICVMDGDKLAGYINFFPIGKEMYNDLHNPKSRRMWDDDITPAHMEQYKRGEPNNIFIISVAVAPEYRDGEAIILLSRSFADYIANKRSEGYPIGEIYGAAVSGGGEKFLKRQHFELSKKLDDGYQLFTCSGDNIEKLCEMGAYKKTYRNDIYFFLPYSFSDMDRVLDADMIKESTSTVGEEYIEAIEENAAYECTNHVIRQMKRFCLGTHKLVCTNDDYDGTVVDYEEAHFVLTVHENSSLCVLAVIIDNNYYSPTQLEDQMATGNLQIVDEESGKIINIHEFMERNYALTPCGTPKCMLGMSNLPADDAEMAYILAAETYTSTHIDYRIACRSMLGWRERNIAKYDYYDAYLSDTAIAFVMKNYPESYDERVSIQATYLFVVELTVFQHSAITRTNMRIVEELDCAHGADLAFVEELYAEFGRTIRFWDQDNFKYRLAQAEADEINKAFATQDILETYNRNQSYLERLVELRGVRSSERENRILNTTVLLLTFLQITSTVTGAVQWLFDICGWNSELVDAASGIALVCVLALLVVILYVMWGDRFRFKGIGKNKKQQR